MQHSVPSQVENGSGNAQETRDEIATLYQEYNELCDRCDALDVQHSSVLAQHDTAKRALELVYTNSESARTVLEALQKECDQHQERCAVFQVEQVAQVQLQKERDSESATHDCRQRELQLIVTALEQDVATLQSDKIITQDSVSALLAASEAAKLQNTQMCTEAQIVLEEIRNKVTLCNADYDSGLEQLRLQSTERETTRVQDERAHNKQRASRVQQLVKINLSLSEKTETAANLDA